MHFESIRSLQSNFVDSFLADEFCSTTFFGQYELTGPGANLSHRAPWAKLLTEADVLPYLGLNFVNGGQWLGTTWPNATGTSPNGSGT